MYDWLFVDAPLWCFTGDFHVAEPEFRFLNSRIVICLLFAKVKSL